MCITKGNSATMSLFIIFLIVLVSLTANSTDSIKNAQSSQLNSYISNLQENKSIASPASQRMSIPPSAKISWDELVRLSEAKSLQAQPTEEIVPYMTIPQPEQLHEIQPQVKIDRPSYDASGAAAIPPVGVNFQALLDDGTAIPPDTHGAVGKSHVMTMLNTQVRIQDKSGNIISTVSDNVFWAPAGGSGVFDPRLVYDQGADRWLATCDANRRSASASVLFAISDNDDPTGNWTFYNIDADATNLNWNDFPDIGFNNTWIAITNNMYSNSADDWIGNAMWVIDKSTALAGGALTFTFFPPGSDIFGGYDGGTLRVCHTFGSEPKLYIVDNAGYSAGNHLIRISEITGTASAPVWSATPGSSPYGGTGWFFVDMNFDWSLIDASQLGTTVRIDTNDPRISGSAVFRNGHIWICHSGGLPVGDVDRTAVFWYELDPSSMPNPIVQSGYIYGGVDVHHFFPSITANANGDAFIGFTRSSPYIYAEAVYTGRLVTDPLGTMDDIRVLKAGEDRYIKDFGGTRVRWGDYSATVIDPSNDLCAWTIQEYAAFDVGSSASDDRWGTWWGQICVGIGDIDNDGVADEDDNCPNDYNPLQVDTDGDQMGDLCDFDDDNDGVPDALDPDDFDPTICGDSDADGCDDCSVGTDGFGPNPDNYPSNDGFDTDGDGMCNTGDPDDDNDGVLDADDTNPFDPTLCEDIDSDGCDDCSVGTDGFGALPDNNPNNDGTDTDSDGLCDLSDCCFYARGNADGDFGDKTDVDDLIYMVDYAFRGGDAVACLEEGDVDASGVIDVDDLIYMVDFAFKGGDAPGDCP